MSEGGGLVLSGGIVRWALLVARASLILSCLVASAHAQGAAEPPPRPRIGLVLSGGGALGMAHVGVLKVLDANRIPVDYIAGTSMGSIVGASYASGMSPQEMARKIKEIDWNKAFADSPPRQDRTMSRKELDLAGLWGLEIGVRRGKLFLPKGAIEGQSLKKVFRGFVTEAPEKDFSRLPIPFRAVATDLETGKMVVLDRGDLVDAMRASMSVPGVVSPEPIEGRILLDGGLVRNLPVDVARDMGADVIIAVNLGSPLLKKEDLGNVIGVSLQMINILTQQNVDKSLAELKPGDVLITPDLTGFTSASFNEGPSIIPRGEAAALKVLDQLKRFSMSPKEYEDFRLAQNARLQRAKPAEAVVVRTEGLEFVNPAAVEAALKDQGVKLKEPAQGSGLRLLERQEAIPDETELDRRIARLYGTGDYDRIAYRYADVDGKRVIEVAPTERARGPSYLRLGLRLQSDFKGEGTFNLSAFYNRTWLNRFGAEWRTLAQVGQDPGILTEFYQPLDLAGSFFVAPRAFAGERLWNVFFEDDRVAQYQVREATVGLDIGTRLYRWGELRLGYLAGSGGADPKIAIPGFPSYEYAIGALRGRLTYDQLDNVNFPTSGALFLGGWYSSLNSLGATNQYSQADFSYTQALVSYRAHTVTFGARGGTTYSGAAPFYNQFTLGGFLNLSGYLTGQFAGQDFALARAVYYYRLYKMPPIADGVFVGGSLEAGNVYDRFDGTSSTGLLYSGSVFVGAETLLGPLYIAYGQSFQGGGAFYVYLGRP